MYPDRELIRLAAHRAGLQKSIGILRIQLVADANRVIQPLALLDRLVTFWRHLSPLARLAAVPLGILIARTVFPRLKLLRRLFSWGPIITGAVRMVTTAIKSGIGSTHRPTNSTK